MRYSDSLKNIASALCKVQAEIKNPIKNQTNKGVQGAPKYANLEDTLSEFVRPVLTKHGMSMFQSVKSEENRVGVCTTLLHESGEYIEGDYVYCDVIVPISSKGNKILTEGQATGVNITYLRRYSLNAALGINGDKDTDGAYTSKPLEEETAPADMYQPMTYEKALELIVDIGKHTGKALKDVYKEDKAHIRDLYELGGPDLKQAINIINREIKKNHESKADSAVQ